MELNEFINNLNLGKIRKIERYKNGEVNVSYKIMTDSGVFTLRIYNFKKPKEISFEIKLLRLLKGRKVPKLIKIGKGYIKKFNDKYTIVYKYIKGDNILNLSNTQLEEVGKFIAEFHIIGENFLWNKKRYQLYNLPDRKIKKFCEIIKKSKIRYLQLLPKIIVELKENRLNNNLPEGPIHADIKPENVLFYKNKFNGVIDFDNAYIGPYILDLTKAMIWFGSGKKLFNIINAIHIYKGYITKRKLSDIEYKELFKAMKYAFLSHIFVDYYMRAINSTSQDYFETIIKGLYSSYKHLNKSGEFYKLLEQ